MSKYQSKTVVRRQLKKLGLVTSNRKLSKIMTVCNVLKNKRHLKPYKMNNYHALTEEDYSPRVYACEELLKIFNEDFNFITNLITSNEVTFHINGCVNRHNCKIWESKLSNDICIKSHLSPKVYVWVGLTYSGVICSVFL